MTSLVGINCKDGVVIGADSATTFTAGAYPTIEQISDKITIMHDQIIVAGTGSVGLGQRFEAIVEELWNKSEEIKAATVTHIQIGVHLSATARHNFSQTGYYPQANYRNDAPYGALVAFPIASKSYLCQFEYGSFQPEFELEKIWYCSMGSAQPITDPFLALIREVFWDDGLPTVKEAVFAATWTLSHAVDVNAGGVNAPVRIAVLEDGADPKARILEDADLEEHYQCIRDAKIELKEFRRSYNVKTSDTNVEDIPQLEELA